MLISYHTTEKMLLVLLGTEQQEVDVQNWALPFVSLWLLCVSPRTPAAGKVRTGGVWAQSCCTCSFDDPLNSKRIKEKKISPKKKDFLFSILKKARIFSL